MDIQLTTETIELLTNSYRNFDSVDLESMFSQLDTRETRNLAAFQIGMARQVPIPQEHPLVGHFWYPPEIAAAYHLQNSTTKIERLARFVHAVAEATPVDEIHDVGANAGLFAAFCSAQVPVPFHCYEPIPLLEDYITANAPSAAIHQVALGEQHGGEVSFFVNSQSLQTSSLDRESIIEDTAVVTEITVPMRRLDQLATGKTIVKIDVQGAELAVLAGMEGCLDDCEALLVESTYLSLDTVTDIIPLAKRAGFSWLYVVNDVSFGADVLLTRDAIEACREAAATSFSLAI